MRKKVSVIIPVYNTEKYLKRCIGSIVNQTYANLEIILVDDGSTDDSLKICKEYEQVDGRIYIISGKNYGVSHARNEAMRKATGDYLCFVDSDDFLIENAIEIMLDKYEKTDCELVIAGYNEIENDEKATKKSWGNSILNSGDAKKLVLDENGVGGYLWNKLFKTSLIKDNDIRFDEKICVWEDVLFVMEYLDNCKSVDLIDDVVYAYCRRFGSAVEYSWYSPRLHTQLNAIEKIESLVYLDELTKELLEYRKARCCLGLIRSMGIGRNIEKDELKRIRLQMNDIPQNVVRNKLSMTDRISWFLVKLYPELFVHLYCFAKKLKNKFYDSYIW